MRSRTNVDASAGGGPLRRRREAALISENRWGDKSTVTDYSGSLPLSKARISPKILRFRIIRLLEQENGETDKSTKGENRHARSDPCNKNLPNWATTFSTWVRQKRSAWSCFVATYRPPFKYLTCPSSSTYWCLAPIVRTIDR
jgi:hypothetical protein